MAQSKIHIYTSNFGLKGKFSAYVKNLLGKGHRGPDAVVRSLTTGLHELKSDFVLNLKPKGEKPIAGVLNGVDTLRWAIQKKRHGKFSRLVAGPNLVISPLDHESILLDPAIDRIVVPSQWTREHFETVAPVLKGKIFLWPAGVDVPELRDVEKSIDYLVFNKIKDASLANSIEARLRAMGKVVRHITYGSFRQEEYFELLEKSRAMVYISETESQGLAVFEAWARNVPTLMYERGYFSWNGVTIQGNTATPFLESRAGLRFADEHTLIGALPIFEKTRFEPRAYVLENFTHKICAQRYLDIILQP